jgi:hypothetical protein
MKQRKSVPVVECNNAKINIHEPRPDLNVTHMVDGCVHVILIISEYDLRWLVVKDDKWFIKYVFEGRI